MKHKVKPPIELLKKMKALTHGGKRKGAGRKPKEPTITKRIPISILDKVNDLILKHKAK